MTLLQTFRRDVVQEADFSRYSFEAGRVFKMPPLCEIRSCWDMDMGKRAFRRCLDDITAMKV